MTQGLRLRIRDALRLYPWLSPAIFSCAVGFLILALHRRRTASLLRAGRVRGRQSGAARFAADDHRHQAGKQEGVILDDLAPRIIKEIRNHSVPQPD